MSDPERLSSATYWDHRYRNNKTGWDLGDAPEWLDQKAQSLAPCKVLVVGSGHGHDARAFARAGHEVLGVDFAPRAIEAAQIASTNFDPARLRYLQADVFDLGIEPDSPLREAFDLVWEQTCLCAIDPARRPDYFAAISRVLRSKGQWHAVLWVHHNEGGPPYHLDAPMVHAMVPNNYARTHFEVLTNAHPERALQHLVQYTT